MSTSSTPPRLDEIDVDEASYTQSGTVHLSAFSPPIRSINPLLPLSIIYPVPDKPPRATTPRLIPSAAPLTPYPHDRPSPPERPHPTPGRIGSPAPSSGGSLTVRPALLGSNQSTLKPLLPPFLSLWRAVVGEGSGNTGGKSWQETDSRTARQPERPHWIGSLGEVKMVDELEVEICVLCGRAMGRSEVEVKEFELAGGSTGQHTALNSGEGGEKADKAGVEQMMQGLGLGVGRWMVCRDTAGCDAAVEKATFADDEDE